MPFAWHACFPDQHLKSKIRIQVGVPCPLKPSSSSATNPMYAGVSTYLACVAGCITPPKAAAAIAGCPVIPGLTWKNHIGSGSFGRVYHGVLPRPPAFMSPLATLQLQSSYH